MKVQSGCRLVGFVELKIENTKYSCFTKVQNILMGAGSGSPLD